MIPLIMSGGSGTRLWPVSRAKFPKQFADLFEESLMTKTLKRLIPFGTPGVITTSELELITLRTFQENGVKSPYLFFEPFGKNTAAAIAWACLNLQRRGLENEIVGIFPADHFVQKPEVFAEALSMAEQAAQSGDIATLGLTPTYPSTGFGYIETETTASMRQPQAQKALRFREKPDKKTAEDFIQQGRYFWNAGIFVFQVKTMVKAFQTLQSDFWVKIEKLSNDQSNLKAVYESLPSISIDYAIMEKLPHHTCITCDIGWSDVGSWDEMAQLKPNHNDVTELESSGCYVFSNENKNYSFIGMKDLILVDTADALLITKKGESQKVKDIVEMLKSSPQTHRITYERNFEYRPWGRFEVLRDTDSYKSKVIQVNPGHQLSYQSHAKRAEHWVIIKGSAEVVLNDVVHRLKPGESIFIPQGAKHRMRNSTNEVVEFVEVQVGSYFGEDDIVRYQDDYNRLTK